MADGAVRRTVDNDGPYTGGDLRAAARHGGHPAQPVAGSFPTRAVRRMDGAVARLARRRKGGEKSALDEIQEEYGFKANAIVSMADVVEYLYNKECNGKVVIDDTIKTAIDEYYKQYGAK